MGGKDSRVWGHKCSCVSEVREKDRTRRGKGKLALEGKRGAGKEWLLVYLLQDS